MTTAELIRHLGGPTRLGNSLGLTPQTVWNWGERGIPAEYHIRIWAMAQAADIDWTPDTAGDVRMVLIDAA